MLIECSMGNAPSLERRSAAAPARVSAAGLPPRVLLFDSGLGGLSVLDAVARTVPDALLFYAADDAVFPYGRLSEAALVDRVLDVVETLVGMTDPDVVVIACSTASTLVLPPLRARYPRLSIVGTVPAIKPAAALSASRLISVLATPGTVARQYTRDLVRQFAGGCEVTLVGAPRLASLAEAALRGETIEDAAVAAEMAGAFVEGPRGRTDVVVLACTHYPLLLDRLERLAPWPVAWVDPAPAIARRVADIARAQTFDAPDPSRAAARPIPAFMTSGRAPGGGLSAFLAGRGIAWQACDPF